MDCGILLTGLDKTGLEGTLTYSGLFIPGRVTEGGTEKLLLSTVAFRYDAPRGFVLAPTWLLSIHLKPQGEAMSYELGWSSVC